jgi:23S rRNA (pseudouridine1915-N3)-methyltransferase
VRIVLVAVVSGKNPAWLEDFAGEYTKRLGRWCTLEPKIIKSPKIERDDSSFKIAQEEKLILQSLEPQDFLVLCDQKGQSFSSLDFSKKLEMIMGQGRKRIVFLIGGAYGVGPQVRKRADLIWSFSPMTLNHQLAFAVLVEQIYRGFSIMKGVPYHNE